MLLLFLTFKLDGIDLYIVPQISNNFDLLLNIIVHITERKTN